MCLTDCGVENCALMVLIFFLMKNLASRQLLELMKEREEEDKEAEEMF